MDLPVVILAFANDQDAYLEQLKWESRHLYQSLEKLEDRGVLYVYRLEHADTTAIIHAFNRFAGRIVLFHYAGHAHSRGLRLEDKDGQADGLAQLLKNESRLGLVFLNGCGTREQIGTLLRAGVPAIVATRTTIRDRQASEFAQFFYEKLANGGNLQQAFKFAASSLEFNYQEHPAPKIYRGLQLEEAQMTADDLPWGLYQGGTADDQLHWSLPTAPVSSRVVSENFEVNEYLYPILEAMAAEDERIAEQMEKLADEREYLELIIKNFPWNIGAQIGMLVAADTAMLQPSLTRLEQILSTYMAVIQWLYFVALSQLWTEQTLEESAVLPCSQDMGLQVNRQNYATFDYLQCFRRIMALFQKHGKDPFLPELQTIAHQFQDKTGLYDAYHYLETVRQQWAEQDQEPLLSNLGVICEEAEYALSHLLQQMVFLVKYQMITVREIVLFHPRHLNTNYRHKMGKLNAHADNRLMIFREPRDYASFMHSDSVILMKDIDNEFDFLNLTPFFIDKNTFGNKSAVETDLYTYAYTKTDERSGKREHCYFKSSHNLLQSMHRPADQLHTGQEVVSDFSRKGVRGRKVRPIRLRNSVKPYAMLEDQFTYFAEKMMRQP